MFDWNNKLSIKLLKLYFVKRWRSSFFHNSHVYQNCQTVLFEWFSKFWTDQDFKISIVWQLKNHWWWRQNKCKQHLKLAAPVRPLWIFMSVYLQKFFITGVGKWSTWLPADPLGCLGCKLGKSLPVFKILLKEKQI